MPLTAPITSVELDEEVERSVLAVLRSGQLAQGPVVQEFERLCAEMAGTAHAVAVSNGTVSLESCLEVLGVGPGDEVITSPLTFAATLNAIVRTGATVRFADVAADYTIDPEAVAALVGPRTAAVMPVHLYGQPANLPALSGICDRHGLAIVEDAAQAHGAAIAGRPVGGAGMGSFSFYATKNVTSGEGGVVTTDDADRAAALRRLRNQGMERRYEYVAVGRNLRMTDLQAAVAVPQMRRLAEARSARRRNAEHLSAGLSGVQEKGLVLPRERSDEVHAWHQYTVLLPGGADRDAFVDSLGRAGVGAGVYYPKLVWDYPPYRELDAVRRDDSTPTAQDVVRRCVSLPVHPHLSQEQLDLVVSAVEDALT